MQDDILRAAQTRGILNDAQAEALRKLAIERSGEGGAGDERIIAPRSDVRQVITRDDEDLKFIGGFGDIFVTIGLGLFLAAVAYFGSRLGSFAEAWNTRLGSAGLIVAAATWFLAEYFTRRRRMALPSIFLLVVFIGSCFTSFTAFFLNVDLFATNLWLPLYGLEPDGGLDQRLTVVTQLAETCGATAILAATYYWRFRVPIAVAGAAAVLSLLAVSFAFAVAPEFATSNLRMLVLICGLAIFALAMSFDTSDVQRRTRRSDIAFWLHLLAAPLIVHPILSPIARTGALTATGATLVIAVFFALGFVAVAIDRRALLVSSLTYAFISFATLTRKAGLSNEFLPFTSLILGGLILLVSVGWHASRRAILSTLPTSLTKHLHNPFTKVAGAASPPGLLQTP